MFKEIILFFFIYSFAHFSGGVDGAWKGKGKGCGSYFVKQMFHLFSDEKIERKIQQAIGKLKNPGKEKKIAFTAGIPKYETYSAKQILKFTRVITNVGGGLNGSDGIFYCPEPGLYYFFVNIMSGSSTAYAQIYKNDQLLMVVVSDYSKSWKTGSNAVILQLRRGDRVSVKSYTSYNFHPEATYFSGHKI